jgi:hypothetical protein
VNLSVEHLPGKVFPSCFSGSSTVFRELKEDLRYYFGNDFVHELEVIERNLILGGK